MSATKYDSGKPKLSLISPDVLLLLLPDTVPTELKIIMHRISMAAHSTEETTYRYHLSQAILGLRDYLSPKLAILEITKGLEYGLAKYHRNNWKEGMEWSRVLDAALRHLVLGPCMNEQIDEESSNTHYAHALCMLMFAYEYIDMTQYNDIYPEDESEWVSVEGDEHE